MSFGDRMDLPRGAIMPAHCNVCSHYKPVGTCVAFPNGISMDVLWNEVDHREPIPGDGGIRFSPRVGMRHPGNNGAP
jgi:hypothetical protein